MALGAGYNGSGILRLVLPGIRPSDCRPPELPPTDPRTVIPSDCHSPVSPRAGPLTPPGPASCPAPPPAPADCRSPVSPPTDPRTTPGPATDPAACPPPPPPPPPGSRWSANDARSCATVATRLPPGATVATRRLPPGVATTERARSPACARVCSSPGGTRRFAPTAAPPPPRRRTDRPRFCSRELRFLIFASWKGITLVHICSST